METEITPKVNAPHASQKGGAKIFIIDDDPMYSKTIQHQLGKYTGYSFYSFNTGEESLVQLEKINPDIVVLDYILNESNMQAKNGLEILKRIKKVKPDIPILMLSGNENIDLVIKSIRYGADDFIVKDSNAFTRLSKDISNALNALMYKNQEKQQESYAKYMTLGLVVLLAVVIVSFYFLPNITPWLIVGIMLAIILVIVIDTIKTEKEDYNKSHS